MIDPVMTVTGGTYERSVIEEWLKYHDIDPLTNISLTSKKLIPNSDLLKEIRKNQGEERLKNYAANKNQRTPFASRVCCLFLNL